ATARCSSNLMGPEPSFIDAKDIRRWRLAQANQQRTYRILKAKSVALTVRLTCSTTTNAGKLWLLMSNLARKIQSVTRTVPNGNTLHRVDAQINCNFAKNRRPTDCFLPFNPK
ncbi:hypothetical protein, partial [Pararhodobacter sp. SW119]|uniref:hypothetical protein n=1 Tax=Pararhodobacter sp. SW119 TaxID=2780075 RepID=UPI001ADECAC3